MKSIFKGKNVKEIYWFGTYYYGFYCPRVNSSLETISYKTFLEIDLSEPPLNKEDKFYNLETDETYFIEDVMRGTGDTMVYFTDKILEKIIDEESKQKAEEDKRAREEVQQEKEARGKIAQPEPEPKKSWWKNLFSK